MYGRSCLNCSPCAGSGVTRRVLASADRRRSPGDDQRIVFRGNGCRPTPAAAWRVETVGLPSMPTRQRPARRPEANLAQLAPEEELIQKQVAEQHEEQHDEGFRDFHNGCHPYRILLSPLEQSDRISVRCRSKCCSNTLSMKFPTVKRRLPATPTRVVILRCSRRSI